MSPKNVANLTANPTNAAETTYSNVMEDLIHEEVDRCLKRLPPKKASYINRVQVITYALNRVPPLYASSAEGIDRQRKYARRELSEQIEEAVKRAFAAISYDPLRTATPIVDEEREILLSAEQALTKIRAVFGRNDLSWDAIANWVARAAAERRQLRRSGNLTASARPVQPVRQDDRDTAIPDMQDSPPISVWDFTGLR